MCYTRCLVFVQMRGPADTGVVGPLKRKVLLMAGLGITVGF